MTRFFVSNKEKVISLIGALVLSVLFYGYYIHIHYGLDAYGFINGGSWSWFKMATHGRPFFDLVMQGLFYVDINPVHHIGIFSFFMILIIALSIHILYCTTVSYLNGKELTTIKKGALFLAVSIGFLNFFYQEWFNFVEGTVQFAGSLFFATLSIYLFQKHSIRTYVMSTVLLCIALGFYQAVLGLFVIWSMFYSFLLYINEKSLKLYLKKSFFVLLVGAIAAFENVAFTKFLVYTGKIYANVRSVKFDFNLILNNINNLVDTQDKILNHGYYHMPDRFFLIILSILIINLFVEVALCRKRMLLFVCSITLIVSYTAPFLLFITSESFWLPPRTIVSYMSFFSVLLGMLIIIPIQQPYFDFVIEKTLERLVFAIHVGICVYVFGVNLIHVQKETLDLFETNELDYYISKQIEYKLSQYEVKSGNNVSKIKWHVDTNYVSEYPHVTTHAFDTNSRAYNVVWSLYGFFDYTMGRNFEIEEMTDEDYQRLFLGKNWDYFIPDECLCFENNVMYFIIN